MPDNFLKTAERMYDSSKILHRENHSFNACYLSGYVAECYAKIMLELATSTPIRTHDISRILNNIPSFFINSPAHNKYWIDLPIQCPKMYSGVAKWNPLKRYSDSCSWDTATSAAFQREMDICFDKITEMILDGIIT